MPMVDLFKMARYKYSITITIKTVGLLSYCIFRFVKRLSQHMPFGRVPLYGNTLLLQIYAYIQNVCLALCMRVCDCVCVIVCLHR